MTGEEILSRLIGRRKEEEAGEERCVKSFVANKKLQATLPDKRGGAASPAQRRIITRENFSLIHNSGGLENAKRGK